jgi:hypothetical protein
MSEINAAIVSAAAEARNIVTNERATVRSQKGEYSYQYASLPSILDMLRPILHTHGLAVVQSAASDQNRVGVHTLVVHKSGETLDCGSLLLLPANDSPQAYGSCITYARRYALTGLFQIGVEDDDGNAAQQPAKRQAARAPQRPVRQPQVAAEAHRDDKEPPWVDDVLGFGKHRTETWRHMASGSVNGERHEWALWLLGEIDAKERSGEKPTPAGLERKERVLWVVQKIEEQIPQTGEAF